MEPDTFPDWFKEPVFLDGHDKRWRRDTGYNVSSTGSHHDDFVPWSTTTYRPVGHDVMSNYGETHNSYPTATDSTITSWVSHSSTPTTQPVNGTPLSYDSGSFQAGFEATVTGDEWYNSFAALDAQSGEYQVGRLETDQIQCDRLSPSDTLYCYGMLPKIPILSHRTGLSTITSSPLDLHFVPPNSLLLPSEGREFGQLKERTAEILAALAAQSRITLQIIGHVTKQRAKIKLAKGFRSGQNDLQYNMNAIIYGPREFSEGVGDFLAKSKMFLQDPLECDRDVPYLNPHLLSHTVEVVMTSSLRPATHESSTSQGVVAVDARKDLFSQICDDAHLALTDPPDLLHTKLYKHQKKALTFMKQREQDWSFEDTADSLWVREVDDAGDPMFVTPASNLTQSNADRYTNLVTEQYQQNEPSQARGGLLADQMGLGKTLTMISLIALNPAKLASSILITEQGTIRRIKSTLIVVPFSLLDTWDAQLRRHLKPNSLSWFKFHSSQKRKLLSLGGHDIIITTYETLMGQMKKHNDPAWTKSTLFSFAWHRIVLDEAHVIRNRSTAIAQACCALRASRRWAMTGTPIQNKPTDLGSLLEFLQLEPFGDPKTFEAMVIKPWLKSADEDMSRLKKLIRYVSLYRTKAIIELPPREDLIHYVDFGPEEAEFYALAKNCTIQQLNEALSMSPIAPGRYLNALEWVNELRLICNYGLMHSGRKPHKTPTGVSSAGSWNKTTAKNALATLVNAGSAICKLCHTNIAGETGEIDSFEHFKPSLSRCLAIVCGSCVQTHEDGNQVSGCSCNPVCPKTEVTWALETPDKSPQAVLPSIEEGKIPTKLKRLLADLQEHEKAEKSVVFSCWTYTLDLVESLLLQRTKIQYARIDGNISGSRRDQAIQRFQTDDSVRVILVSIVCGGTGIDLTAGSRAYLLEPQWNPMVEEQALARIHRIGQTKKVKTIRYLVRNSFEERVVMLQDLKRDIAAGAFSSASQVDVVNSSSQLQVFRNAF
ncbi:hypothetical protein LTR46_003167 [Exophiala xenobiotica]|nr:hypothetical protein LTR46_003167 [Exophiala xenobiotica]